jgi:hypothetical protein
LGESTIPFDFSIESIGQGDLPWVQDNGWLPPEADAGPDQVFHIAGSLIRLDGGESYDPAGTSLSFHWTLVQKPCGSLAALSDPTVDRPTFTADVYGVYILSLVVTNRPGNSSLEDRVLVSFENLPPVADAGDNQSVYLGDLVHLDGSASADPNNDVLYYDWAIAERPEGSLARLDAGALAKTSFVPDLPGNYVITLQVSDGSLESALDQVEVEVVSARDLAVESLVQAIKAINGLDASAFKGKRHQRALTRKISRVLNLIEHGRYGLALSRLKGEIQRKLNGDAYAGAPDRNDWIISVDAQSTVYPLILEAVAHLDSLVN